MIRNWRFARNERCTSLTGRWSTWRRNRDWSPAPARIPKGSWEVAMFSYYLGLALRSLKRNKVLTALMIAAIGVGIGASMTTLTVFRAMSGDPIPGKSRQLFAVQIDNWGPRKGTGTGDAENMEPQLTYI